MATAASSAKLRDSARLARDSIVIARAVTLARWIGASHRPVTQGRVLRKADVPDAGALLGLDVPHRLRTMADIPALHRPWCVAVATGLLHIGDGSVTGGPALAGWPPAEADLLAGWLTGLRAVCAAESGRGDEDGLRLLAIALLTVLAEDVVPADSLWAAMQARIHELCDRYDKFSWQVLQAADRYYDLQSGTPLSGLISLLSEFGAVVGDDIKPVITPLGRWAVEDLAAGLPGLAAPSLPAAEMIAEAAQFDDEDQQAHVMRGWLAGRPRAEAAREILTVAEGMSPSLRSVAMAAVERLDEDALSAWQDMTAARCVGPYARAVLASWEQGPEPSAADWRWLAVESAAIALVDRGPDAALSSVWEQMPGADLDDRLAIVRGTGHPEAEALAGAVADFATSGAPRSIDQLAELKVSLPGVRPPIWRRVRLPVTASLGDLHVVIQMLFGWDGDHLHLFGVGKKQYSDPFVRLEGTKDEDAIRISDALAMGAGSIKYTYDLGADWEHEITLVSTVARDLGQDYPICVAYQGDSPVEYWSPDDPVDCEPFDLAAVNRELAALSRVEE